MGNFPKFMYHPINAPVQVNSIQQQLELGPEWSEIYVHQAYPRWKFHWIKPDQRVANAEEEAKLGAGWADSAAAFTPYKDPARARPQHPDPLKWLADWMVPGLSPNHREKLKAQLLEAHAAFWKAPERPSAAVDSMRLAFDGIAKVLLEAEILTEQLLESDIPLLVWDSAIAGGWWHLASEERKDIFPERLGHYWVGATTVNWDRLGWRGASIPLFESKARYKERALNCGSPPPSLKATDLYLAAPVSAGALAAPPPGAAERVLRRDWGLPLCNSAHAGILWKAL